MPHLRYGRHRQHGFIEAIFAPSTRSLEVAITAKRSKGQACSFTASLTSDFNGQIFFNSYYLDDGDYKLSIEVNELESGRTSALAARIHVCNGSSAMAQLLRDEFRSHPELAIVANELDSSYFLPLAEFFQDKNYPLKHRNNVKPRTLSPQQISTFDTNGYLILEGHLSSRVVDGARKALQKVCEQESHGFARDSSDRIVNLHTSIKALNAIYLSTSLYEVVSDLFGCQALPCQSLTFIHGSTQDAHQDTIHLTPFPRGFMCGIWIALEDVVPGSGELFYYPGSHRLPAVLCSTHGVPKVDSDVGDYSNFGAVFTPAIRTLIASQADLQPQTFLPKAGDVLIWQENLIHGGSPRILRDQTRMSMVIHAFAEPALVYYDSTGISGKRDMATKQTLFGF